MTGPSPPADTCPECDAPIPRDAPEGLCPSCLITLSAEHVEEPPAATGVPAPEAMAALFPQFEIVECLGRGGMGIVYKARQPELNRFVALKVIALDKTADPTFHERFAREAQTLARMNHPGIVTVHDFGRRQDLVYLVMEYVDGLSLRELLLAGRMAPSTALELIPQICEALQYAHRSGVVHRDIKPENILLDRNGRVKIADFGIAKIIRPETGAALLTGDRQSVGTPHYMAPEQVEQPHRVDHRADIYSLGVVLYEMLTGELPIGRFQLPSQKVRLDVRLDQVVLRALAKEPERRYQTAREVKHEVETIVASIGSPETEVSPGTSGPAGSATARPLFTAGVALLSGMLGVWSILVGAPRAGIDLDADVRFWTGLLAPPFAATAGALLTAWWGKRGESGGSWNWRLFLAGLLLIVWLGLVGAGLVVFQLVSAEIDWNPSSSEAVFTFVLVAAAVLVFLVAALLARSGLRPLGPARAAIPDLAEGARLLARILSGLHLLLLAPSVVGAALSLSPARFGIAALNPAGGALMLAGFVAGWWREGTAALLLLAGWTVAAVTDPHEAWSLLVFVPVAAALFAFRWWSKNAHRWRLLCGVALILAVILILARSGPLTDRPDPARIQALELRERLARMSDEVAARPFAQVQARPGVPGVTDLEAVSPVVISTQPESGAADVDPGLAEIRVVFSKAMRTGTAEWRSWTPDPFPSASPGSFQRDEVTWTLEARLKPGTVYGLWIEGGFVDAHGRPCVPYLLVFKTKETP